jgi:hypothetical protein
VPPDFVESTAWPGSRETAVTVISWGLFGSAYEWSRGKRERSAEELAEELAAVLVPPALRNSAPAAGVGASSR